MADSRPSPAAARATVALGLALALGWTCRPWATSAAWTLPHRDGAFSALAIEQLQALILSGGPLGAGGMAWPGPGWAQTDVMVGQALLGLLLRPLVDPVRAYVLLCLLGMALTGVAAAQAARRLGMTGPEAVVPAVVGATGAMHLIYAAHANQLWHAPTVWAGLLLAVGLHERRPGLALLGGLAGGAAGVFGAYMGLHTGLVVLCVLPLLALGRRGDGRSWAAALLGLAAGLLPALTLAGAWRAAAAEMGAEVSAHSSGLGWDPGRVFTPVAGAPLHSLLRGDLSAWSWLPPQADQQLVTPWNPGLVVGLLALVGLVAVLRRRARPWLLVLVPAVVAAALALGPEPVVFGRALPFPGPYALLGEVGANLRSPERWLVLVELALGLLAAAGAGVLLGRLPAPLRAPLALALALLATLERGPVSTAPTGAFVPGAVYAALDAVTVEGPLFERFGHGCDHDGVPRLWAAMGHGRPLVGGHYARFSERSEQLQRALATWPSPRALRVLRATGVTVVLEHPPLRGEDPGGAACERVDGHRLCVLEGQPWPAAEALGPAGEGPVVGLRYAQVPTDPIVVVRCEAEPERPPEQHRTADLRTLAAYRTPGGEGVDLLLDSPCDGAVQASAPGGEPLVRSGPDPGWLPPLPPRRRTVAALLAALPPAVERPEGPPPSPGSGPPSPGSGPPATGPRSERRPVTPRP